jgi:hypothetical protein
MAKTAIATKTTGMFSVPSLEISAASNFFDRRENNRAECRHVALVAGKSVRVADIMRGIVDGIDMGKTDHADNQQAECHREGSLEYYASTLGGKWSGSDVSSHGDLLRERLRVPRI